MLSLSEFRKAGWCFVRSLRNQRYYGPHRKDVRYFACPLDLICLNGEGYRTMKEAKIELTKYLSLKTLPVAVATARETLRANRDLFEREYPV